MTTTPLLRQPQCLSREGVFASLPLPLLPLLLLSSVAAADAATWFVFLWFALLARLPLPSLRLQQQQHRLSSSLRDHQGSGTATRHPW